MSDAIQPWRATVTVESRTPALARSLELALRPEASREVPRARAELRRATGTELELRISAADTGAIRAALNTYLGWIHLAGATVRSVEPVPGGKREPRT
jgi:tRNA threonylcarbamoyladenosine modification (KEOPS) complex  Pcc1 subunit